MHWFKGIVIALLAARAATAPGPKLTNAALPRNGARISLRMIDPQGGKDQRTGPEDAVDGNPHTRCVVWGAPYAFTIELADKLPIESVNFILDDYESEAAPKDVEVKLDDGSTYKLALELTRPTRENRFPRQAIPIGKPARTVEVTFLSSTPGKVNWGGIGEIEVMTAADLTALLTVPDYDPNSPVYIRDPLALLAVEPAPKVTMPPKAGEAHPRCLLTPSEVAEIKALAAKNERAKTALDALIGVADGFLDLKLDFPDPAGPPAQMKDRSDDLAKQHSLLSKAAGSLTIAYQLTDNRRYAAKSREILLGYAERYQKYPMHRGVNGSDSSKVMAQRLSEAMWLIPQILATDYVWETLSADDRTKIADDLIRPALHTILSLQGPTFAQAVADLDKRQPNWREEGPPPPTKRAGAGNWMNFYNATYILGGCVLDDKDLRDYGVYQEKALILNGISPDGMWNEGAIGYQMFALQAMMLGTEAAARAGIDLYGYQNARLKQLFDSPLRYAYPDSTSPGINDSGRSDLFGWSSMVYDYAYLRYGDTRYAEIINRTARQLLMSEGVYYPTRVYEPVSGSAMERFPSTVFGSIGYAILREGAGKAQQYLLLDYGPHGGTHGHLDKLHLVYYADGDELGGEPQFHRYEDPLHAQWTRQSLGHGTMTVDERSQMPCEGRLTCFAPGDAAGLLRGVTPGCYPGVLLDRTTVLTQEYVLDLYRARGPREHTYDLSWLYRGELEASPAGEAKLAPLGARDGYEHLGVRQRQTTAQAWTRFWKSDVTRLALQVAAEPGTDVVDGRDPDGRSIVVARRHGSSVAFVSALQRTGSGERLRSIERLPGIDPAQGAAARAVLADGTTDVLIVREKPGDTTAGDVHTDAVAAFVRLNAREKVVTAHLLGGTFLEGKGFRVQAGKPGVATVERGPDGKLRLAPGCDAAEVTWTGPAAG